MCGPHNDRKTVSGPQLETLSSLFGARTLSYQNMSKNMSFLSNLYYFTDIAAGHIGQAMGLVLNEETKMSTIHRIEGIRPLKKYSAGKKVFRTYVDLNIVLPSTF